MASCTRKPQVPPDRTRKRKRIRHARQAGLQGGKRQENHIPHSHTVHPKRRGGTHPRRRVKHPPRKERPPRVQTTNPESERTILLARYVQRHQGTLQVLHDMRNVQNGHRQKARRTPTVRIAFPLSHPLPRLRGRPPPIRKIRLFLICHR